jgi:CBS domain-containing protein
VHDFDRPVSERMTSPVISVEADTSLHAAEQRLARAGISCLAVVDRVDADFTLVGVLSRTDLLRVGRLRARMGDDPELLKVPRQTVRTRMVGEPVTVAPTAPLREAAAAMARRRIHRVFVVDGGRAVGVFSTRDLMRVVLDARTPDPIAAWMSHPVETVDVSNTIAEATDRLAAAHVRGLVVLDDRWPLGLYGQAEALAAADLPATTRVEEAMSRALLCLSTQTPLYRAAAFVLESRARRICAVEQRTLRGILSGLDFARVVADWR